MKIFSSPVVDFPSLYRYRSNPFRVNRDDRYALPLLPIRYRSTERRSMRITERNHVSSLHSRITGRLPSRLMPSLPSTVQRSGGPAICGHNTPDASLSSRKQHRSLSFSRHLHTLGSPRRGAAAGSSACCDRYRAAPSVCLL
ncbi:hypothetical protein TSAR_002117 [Trichomalopsis sarcophagae]|uniref:Uncharacterized protein n=1 Tax=Trichomalopsis sarcophagae TaxID=543379 RepID=A0A232F0J9_9HYME|nr:hypothetical protein TSAR_002117 [Trichomalopsis sarcophagae]